MQSIVGFSLPKRTARRLTRAARGLGVPRSLLVRMAVERYILDMEFEDLRRPLQPYAAAQGLVSDEDVFRNVS